MIILSIETSGNVCGVALSKDYDIIAEYSVTGQNLHDKLCAELIRRILLDFDYKVSNLDAVAISSGPGSFTGLRIGSSLAKALCFKSNELELVPKLISVPTLHAFANNFFESATLFGINNVLVAIKAQKDTLYYQTFDFLNNKQSEIIMESQENFNKMDLGEYFKMGPYFLNIESNMSLFNQYSANIIAKIAIKKFINNEFENVEKFNPNYIQDFQVRTKMKKLEI